MQQVGTGRGLHDPRDIVHLAATLLLEPDNELFEQKNGLIRTIMIKRAVHRAS